MPSLKAKKFFQQANSPRNHQIIVAKSSQCKILTKKTNLLNSPMIYGKDDQKQYNSKFHKALAVKGHKYVSQIVAVGPSTETNLERITKSSLKLIKSLDFDA